MTPRQAEIRDAVERNRSHTAAGRELGISRSAVSAAMQRIAASEGASPREPRPAEILAAYRRAGCGAGAARALGLPRRRVMAALVGLGVSAPWQPPDAEGWSNLDLARPCADLRTRAKLTLKQAAKALGLRGETCVHAAERRERGRGLKGSEPGSVSVVQLQARAEAYGLKLEIRVRPRRR